MRCDRMRSRVSALAHGVLPSAGVALLTGMLLAGLFSGCMYMAKTQARTWEPAASATRYEGNVLVDEHMQVEGRSFEILGPVRADRFSAWKHDISAEEIKMLSAKLLGPARNMGADAILGLHSGEFRDRLAGGSRVRFWVSGLAGRLLPPGQTPARARGKSIVAVARPYVSPDVAAPPGQDLLKAVQDDVTWRMEQKHYFVRTCEAAYADADSLQRMDDREMNEVFGDRTEFVLTSRVKAVSMEKMKAKALLEFGLFSRSERRVVWRDEAWGISSKTLENLFWFGYEAASAATLDQYRRRGEPVPLAVHNVAKPEVAIIAQESLDARGPAAFLTAVQRVLERIPTAD